MKCAPCSEKKCSQGKDCTGIKTEIKEIYTGEDLNIMKVADKLTDKYYMKKTRIEELIYFAKEMKYKKLGLSFCMGLKDEAGVVDRILSKEFKVISAVCKVCGIEKSDSGSTSVSKDKKVKIACNPLGQAELINKKNTDLNIVLGLCMGHDILFAKYSKAPVTTLAVKDRVLGHNPLAAVYSGFYRKKRFNLKD